jgi:hypothetical protein
MYYFISNINDTILEVNYWEKNIKRLCHILLHCITTTPSVGIKYSKRDTMNNMYRCDWQVQKYALRFPEGSGPRVTMDDCFNARRK